MSVPLNFCINAYLVKKINVSEISQKEDAVDRHIDCLAIYVLQHVDTLLGNDREINTHITENTVPNSSSVVACLPSVSGSIIPVFRRHVTILSCSDVLT
jgi:hypothetical protein